MQNIQKPKTPNLVPTTKIIYRQNIPAKTLIKNLQEPRVQTPPIKKPCGCSGKK
jgi:hypothetical protein